MSRKIIFSLACFLLFSIYVDAQTLSVNGKVTDANGGQGIPGVNIKVKNSSTGTVTKADGSFSLTTQGNSILEISYVGYTSQEIAVNNRSQINVVLISNSNEIGEVVVTALGIKRSERSLGYSTQTVKGENLTLTKEQNVIGSLAGKIAGIQVTGSSGASMGGTQKIKIRSVNSITGGGSPLMVVDGTPIAQSNFAGTENGVDYGNVSQDINPDDIASINVLKGPAASALYGIRGQYGVIIIETKKGSIGPKKVNVGFNSSFSVERVGNFMELQNIYGVGNNQTFLTLANGEKYLNGNDESWGPMMDGTPVRMFYSFYPQDPMYGKLTPFVPQPNNIKDFYQSGTNLNNHVSLSGGNENTTFRFSYTNADIKGVTPNTWLKRNNFGLNTSMKVPEKLSIGANVNYANNAGQRPTQGYQGSFTGAVQWFQRNIDIHKLKNYRYPDGTILNWNVNPNTTTATIVNSKPSDWNNPYFDAYEVLNNDSRDRVFGDINATFQVLPELKISGFIRSDMFTQNITHKEPLGGRLVDGYQVGKYQNTENNYEFLAQYNKNFGDISLTSNFGANLYTVDYSQNYQATNGGLASPGLYTAANSLDRPTSTSFLRKKHLRSMYAMASLGYKNTYFLDASIRNDISSALPANNNSYVYPSVSGSFVFSELLKSAHLSFGKLRASYAIAGSDLSPYQTAFTYALGSVYPTAAGNINTVLVPDNLRNPNIKPSFSKSFEIGTELKFFKNRLGLDFTYYQQANENQIINLAVSGSSGYDNTIVNAGRIENKGIELSINARPIESNLFTWETSLNFARNKNKVPLLYPGIAGLELDANVYSSQRVAIRSDVNAAFGTLIGPGYIYDDKGRMLLGANAMPLFDAAKNFGSVLPAFTGGMMNNFKIWKLDVSAMIDFQKGGQFFSWSRMLAVKSGQALETAAINDKGQNVRAPLASGGGYKISGVYGPGTMVNNVNVGGQEVSTYVDARDYFRNNIGTRIYDEWLYDATYVKLREISIGYNFDSKLLEKTPFKSFRVAAIARNPLMIYQKAPKGVDPSELSSGSAAISWIEKGELQTVRSFGFNLNITF